MSRLRVLINFEASDQWDNFTRANIARKSRNLAPTSRTFPAFPFETENAARSPQHYNWADAKNESAGKELLQIGHVVCKEIE